jgi:hypothetical protein
MCKYSCLINHTHKSKPQNALREAQEMSTNSIYINQKQSKLSHTTSLANEIMTGKKTKSNKAQTTYWGQIIKAPVPGH